MLYEAPLFLKRTPAIKTTNPVVISFYGSTGSRHLRWHSGPLREGADPVAWDDLSTSGVDTLVFIVIQDARQLNFIAGLGRSQKHQTNHVYVLPHGSTFLKARSTITMVQGLPCL